MYCGDETGSFIGEIGSHTARFGYGGQDAPRYVVPSVVVEHQQQPQDGSTAAAASSSSNSSRTRRYIPASCYRAPSHSAYNIKYPVRTVESPPSSSNSEQQLVTDPAQFLRQGDRLYGDWDAYEHAWDAALDALRVHDARKHTVGGGAGSAATTTTAPGGVQSATLQTAGDPSSSIGSGAAAHPILVVDPGCTHSVGDDRGHSQHRKQLLRLTEHMMETVRAGALFVAPAPMLAAFGHGRRTALVVDVGAGGTRVTPVVDGLLLRQAQRRNGRGGDWLDHCAGAALLGEKAGVVRPRYQVARGNSESLNATNTATDPAGGGAASRGIFHRWALQDLMYELRSSVAACPAFGSADATAAVPFRQGTPASEASEGDDDDDDDDEDDDSDNEEDDKMEVEQNNDNANTNNNNTNKEATARHYELPDGTLVDLSGSASSAVGRDLTRVPELWFADDCPFSENTGSSGSDGSDEILQEHPSLSNLPLPRLVRSALSAVADVDARRELAGGILLTGGAAVTPGLERRLAAELTCRVIPGAYRPRVVASKFSAERQFAAWIGASVLTSLGSFQQLWLSRTEYDEYGGTLALQRFPV